MDALGRVLGEERGNWDGTGIGTTREGRNLSLTAMGNWATRDYDVDGSGVDFAEDNTDPDLGTPFHNSCFCYEFRYYVFRRGTDGAWRQVGALTPGDAVPFPWLEEDFGWRGDIEVDRVVVAAPGEYYAMSPFTQTGAVYAFDLGCEICDADLDADGTLTNFDFLLFLNFFQDGNPIADFDGDGELTIFDFLAFQNEFDAGCE